MGGIQDLIDGLKKTDALLADPELEPDLDRKDWRDSRSRVDAVRDAIREVEDRVAAALEEVKGTEIGTKIKQRVAGLYGEGAAVLAAFGDRLRAQEWLGKAESLTTSADQKEEFAAAQRDILGYVRLAHGRWLLVESQPERADKVLAKARSETKEPVLRAAAKKLLDRPRPLTGAPPLFRLNGCGLALYGERDPIEDTYVATYCICLIFIPVFPLTAYRVRRVNENTYSFIAKEKLSGFARGVQIVALAGVLIAIASSAIQGYLRSPSHRYAEAIEQAEEAEKAGDRDRAMEKYRSIADQFAYDKVDVGKAAEGYSRLAAGTIPDPCKREHVEAVRAVANGYLAINETSRTPASAGTIATKIAACAEQIGASDLADAQASTRLFDLALDVAGKSPDKKAISEKRDLAHRSFAERVAKDRPLWALREYAHLSDLQSVMAGKAIIDSFGASPSLWIEAESSEEVWCARAREVAMTDEAKQVENRVKGAHAVDQIDQATIETADEKALRKAFAENPDHQALAVAVARASFAKGDVAGALSVIERLGPAGRLTAEAQLTLARALEAKGDLERADHVLTALVDERLPPFQAIQQAFFSAQEEAIKRITSDLKYGAPPADLERKIAGLTSDDEKDLAVQTWIADKLRTDGKLAPLRKEYLRHTAIVPASLMLGMVKLRRASDVAGAEKTTLLSEAERAFLSIRQEAAGEPSFHMGLGQVYHRLGKTEEGEKELAGVLERNDPDLTISVVATYRDLGLTKRAREVAQGFYDKSRDQSVKYRAAESLAHLATDVDEEEAWFRKGDPASPTVKNALDRVMGQKHLRDGQLADADRYFAKNAAFFERDAQTNGTAANNAAVAYAERYAATGDVAHLKKAAALIEASAKLAPDSALILGNLAQILSEIGFVSVLDKWIPSRTFIPTGSEARRLTDMMIDGPLGAEVLESLRKHAAFQRALEMSRQEQVLAPKKVSAYSLGVQWIGWNHDVTAIQDLAKRLTGLAPFAVDDDVISWREGKKDDLYRKVGEQAISRARQRVARLEKAPKPALAAAYLCLSDALAAHSWFEPKPEVLDEIVTSVKKARELWPEGISKGEETSVLFTRALWGAVGKSPVLAKAWEADRRAFSLRTAALRAAFGPSGAEVLDAIRANPLLAEAVKLAAQQASTEKPTINRWMLAKLAGDADLEKTCAAVFEQPDLLPSLQVAELLDPTGVETKFVTELARNKGKLP